MSRASRCIIAALVLSSSVVVIGQATAQEPEIGQPAPDWSSNAGKQTLILWPTTGKVGLGTAKPAARLHVLGMDIQQEPGSGHLILGAEDSLHLQLDSNEIRVSGPSPETVGTLYLQRFGGPLSIRSSQAMSRRVVFPHEGGLGLGTLDPQEFALDHGLWWEGWTWPNASMAVDGHVAARKVLAEEGWFLERIRIGARGDQYTSAAFDNLHQDATAMIGGKLTSQEIWVHVEHWADDVFDPDYALPSLAETKAFIEEHRHLPGVPGESEVRESGVDLAAMNAVLLRKVEELTLHAIAQQERLDALEGRVDARD